MNEYFAARWMLVLLGLAAGVAGSTLLDGGSGGRKTALGQQSTVDNAELAAIQGEIEKLKGKTPGQAHAMMDVDYHFTNLWFAARSKNWPLADFYWKETQSHMRWAVRIIPVRKDSSGREIKLAEILQSIEQSPLMQVGATIDKQDLVEFETTYRHTLEGCYACHKAADKPYLRPQVPTRVATTIINFDPQADWPK